MCRDSVRTEKTTVTAGRYVAIEVEDARTRGSRERTDAIRPFGGGAGTGGTAA